MPEPAATLETDDPTGTPRRGPPLPALAAASWLLAGAFVALMLGQYAARVVHPSGWLAFAVLVSLLAASGLGVGGGLRRAVVGPRRGSGALGAAACGAAPLSLGAVVAAGLMQVNAGIIAPTPTAVVAVMAGLSLAEIEVGRTYPHRLAGTHVVMRHRDDVPDPEGDLRAMERHVAAMIEATGLTPRAPIVWVRGPLLGKSFVALPGMALGSPGGPIDWVDRHEVAHSFLAQHLDPGVIPPMLLNEGWAEAMSKPDRELAEAAAGLRDEIRRWSHRPEREVELDVAVAVSGASDPAGWRDLVSRARRLPPGADLPYLATLTDPFWHARDKEAVYAVGGAFAAHVIREHGARRFVALSLDAGPGQFAEACRTHLGMDLDTLERAFWADVERIVNAPPAP